MLQFFRDRQASLRNQRLRGVAVFANSSFVRRGEYVPRGSVGLIRRVLPCGDYVVDFEGVALGLQIHPDTVTFGHAVSASPLASGLKLTPTA
ncbi:MAG: hypothetical protein KGM42_05445 [Hyphomicrobiales bacterium]|nr:hypothetical protein [Hyphomicrobiales bacterium]